MSGISGKRRQVVLAERILGHIHQQGLDRGAHLREVALAEHFGVSRTPVRNALKLLAEQGVVRSIPHQGYVIDCAADHLHALSLSMPKSQDEELYLMIVEDHVRGELPDSITQVELLKRYDTNVAMLAKVLEQMAEEGLIERNTGQGWTFLCAFDSESSQRASYEFRRALEPAGLQLPGFELDRAVLEGQIDEHRRVIALDEHTPATSTALFRLDANFHESLARLSGNPLILQAIVRQNRQRRMLEYLGYGNRRRITDWCFEHIAILEALLSGQRAQAAELMTRHLDQALEASHALRVKR